MYFKRRIRLRALAPLMAALMAFQSCRHSTQPESVEADNLQGSISISGAFALYPMAVEWTNEFSARHPAVRIDLSSGGAGKGMTDVLNGMVDFAMLSREPHDEEREKGAIDFTVAKDAVLPVFSASNPLRDKILAHGITADDARKIWITGEYTTWGQLLGTTDNNPIHVYTRSDACGAAQTFAAWFGAVQEDLGGTAVYGDPGISKAVIDDALGIGFNNMAYAYDSETLKMQTGLEVLPLDIDGDRSVSDDEKLYTTRSTIAKAIEEGRFPAPPSRNLYLVTNGVPADTAALEFLKFVITDGQAFNEPNGYVRISNASARESMRKLNVGRKGRGLKRDNTQLMTLIAGLVVVLLFLTAGVQLFMRSHIKRRVYRQKLSETMMVILSFSSIAMLIALLWGLWGKAAPMFDKSTLGELLTGTEWKPSQGLFGFRPFIHGTLAVTMLSICFSLPLSLLTAVFITEYAPKYLKSIVNPALDILASLPSVVFGVWGVLTLIPKFGYSLLTASLVLGVMVLPIMVSLFCEIFATVPTDMRDSSFALGATRWQTTRKVVLRKSLPGIFAAVVLALSKCIGETIAVMMVCGCVPRLRGSWLDPFYTLPALIGNNYGEMASIPLYESAIMFAALLLLLLVLLFNILSRVILYRIEKNS
ncbi:MAG: phosphate ABC transporter permease subunit PstC [Bacteroidaceae bacterium]